MVLIFYCVLGMSLIGSWKNKRLLQKIWLAVPNHTCVGIQYLEWWQVWTIEFGLQEQMKVPSTLSAQNKK